MAGQVIRTNLTRAEWQKIRRLALDRDVPTTRLVTATLRDALLKGAKP